ncbi:MAG: membrane protein insertion efficiency factor YidD [Candidatus Nomurabacteria bacterium]|nr:membrane protein insertion efficiency factor YidD [Candidatus Nomurabacteria bacterium]
MKLKSYSTKLISLYQKTLSPDQGILRRLGIVKKSVCVFYPTCSEYTKEAINKYGILKGTFLGFRRILRCHPWQKNHMDPLK